MLRGTMLCDAHAPGTLNAFTHSWFHRHSLATPHTAMAIYTELDGQGVVTRHLNSNWKKNKNKFQILLLEFFGKNHSTNVVPLSLD